MSRRDIRESEFEDYKYDKYKELKDGYLRVKLSKSFYRCPYCDESRRRDYRYKELLEHASSIGRSRSWSLRENAKHLALEKYMNRYLVEDNRSELSNEPTGCAITSNSDHNASLPASVSSPSKLSSKEAPEPSSKPAPKPSSREGRIEVYDKEKDQLFVHPWFGVVANIKTVMKDGKYVAESGSKLRDELRNKGFLQVLKVHPLWNYLGHSGFALVDFGKEWSGFKDAILFDKSFEVEHQGKIDYYTRTNRGDKLYGWVARDDDFHSKSILGTNLRRMGDLKTVSGKEADDQRATTMLVKTLTDDLEKKNVHVKEMQRKYLETDTALENVMKEKEEMIKSFNEGNLKLSIL